MPGALSLATGLVKNANSTCLNGRAAQGRPRIAPGPRGAPRERRQLLRAVGSRRRRGARRGVVFGVILGTGVGGGIVVDGRVLTGANAIAGEWGHNPLPMPGAEDRPLPRCYCGREGCVETFLSGPGLAADHARATGERLEAEEIARRAAAGDAACEATLGRYEARLARSLAVVVNIVDPDVIVLGGGLSNLLAALRARAGPVGPARLLGRRCARASCRRCTAIRAACAARPGCGAGRERALRFARDLHAGAPRGAGRPVRPHRVGAEGPLHLGARGGARGGRGRRSSPRSTRRWRFTPLVLVLVFLHCVVLMVGAKYTYAEVPWFSWLRDEFGLARNYYDRVGHFAQGFVPAMVAREILLRNAVLRARALALLPRDLRVPRRSARSTSSSSGGWPSPPARRPTPSSAPRATRGTRSGTCSSPCAAPSSRRCCSRERTTGSSAWGIS